MTSVEQVAAAVLYEGYILWPYRRSARKNQQRWTFGGIYPRPFAESDPGRRDPWRMQTQCLVVADAGEPTVDVRVRFLQVVQRRVARRLAHGGLDFVDEIQIGGERYLAWDEAREREVAIAGVPVRDGHGRVAPIDVAAGEEHELLADGQVALARGWRALHGAVEVSTEQLRPGVFRLGVAIHNTTPCDDRAREHAVRQAFVSTHTILTLREGAFVSLMDPPVELKSFAEQCDNVGTWPVLAGEDGSCHTILSSPIILYDYPRIAPESHGDLFDAGEIDQLLALNILTLTDEEKAEMRATDPRVRDILDRTEALTAKDMMGLHGTIRELRVLREEGPVDPLFNDVERAVPSSIRLAGVEVGRGSRVRLRPRTGGDIMDLALADKLAIVEAIEQDYDERIHLAVTVEDDPGRDLGQARAIGHRFFFSPDEVEPI